MWIGEDNCEMMEGSYLMQGLAPRDVSNEKRLQFRSVGINKLHCLTSSTTYYRSEGSDRDENC